MSRLIWNVFLLTTIASLIVACAPAVPAETPIKAPAPTMAPKPAPAAGFMRPPEPNPKRGGTLRTAFGVTVPHFDIHQAGTGAWHVLTMMYNNLVRKDLTDGLRTIIPDLAERWEVSSDGKTITFYLRDGVKFHDGAPFTSEDVVATFNRIIFPPAGMVSPRKELFEAVEKVEALDRLRVRFVLKYPSPVLLEVLTMSDMVIVSKKTLDENNQDLRKVIAPGTGAFVFKDHKVAEKWIFERNPNYWDPELPYIDRLEMLHVPAFTDRGTAVLTGQADFTWNCSVDTWQEGQRRKDIVSTAIWPNPGGHTAYFNHERKPFNDWRVRRAISLVVNRQDIFKAYSTQEPVAMGRWMSLASPCSPSLDELEKLPGYRADKTADIAEAKKLMAEAGYPNGFGPVELVASSPPAWSEIMAPAFQDQIRRTLNIDSKIRVVERGLAVDEHKRGNFDVFVEAQFFSPIMDYMPAWNLHLKCGGSQNFARYCNPEFDKLLGQLNVEMDQGKRCQLFKQGMDLLDRDAPFFMIGFTQHSAMWRNYVKGLALEKRFYVEWGRIETVWLDK